MDSDFSFFVFCFFLPTLSKNWLILLFVYLKDYILATTTTTAEKIKYLICCYNNKFIFFLIKPNKVQFVYNYAHIINND
jgi:hypothetical protein